jgi:hypothetical protein
MSHFVYDGTSIPGTKTDAGRLSVPASQALTAAEVNTITAAIADLRSAVASGQYLGLASTPGAEISVSGKARLRLNGTDIELSINGQPYARVNLATNAKAFGVVSGADSTTQAIALRAAARTAGFMRVELEPGAYTWRNNRIVSKLANVHILAYGSTFKNIGEYPTDFINSASLDGGGHTVVNGGDSSSLVVNGDFFYANADAPPKSGTANAPVINPSYPIVTQAAGGTTIEFSNHADAANFTAGEPIFVYGLALQEGGYPPNLQYKDYRKVRSVNTSTGVVTLDKPLLNPTDSRWYDQTMVIAYGNLVFGPSRVLRLSANQTWCETFILEGATGVDHVLEGQPASTGGYGRLETHGAQYVHLIKCRFGIVTPSQNETARFTDCDIGYMEIDKLLNNVIIDGGRYHSITGATGCDNLTVRDADVFEQISTYARRTTYIGCRFWTSDSVVVGGAYATLINCTFFPRHSNAVLVPGSDVYTLAACTAVTSTSITIPDTDWAAIHQNLFVGARLFKGAVDDAHIAAVNSNYGIVTNIRKSSSNLIIDADFVKTPTIGDVFQYLAMNEAVAINCRNGYTDEPVTFAYPERVRRTTLNGATRRRTITAPLSTATGVNTTLAIGGYLEKITVIVEGAAVHPSGPTSYILLNISTSAAALPQISVDTIVAGTREITANNTFAPSGITGDEALTKHDGRFVRELYFSLAAKFSVTPTTFPRGLVVIDVIDHD